MLTFKNWQRLNEEESPGIKAFQDWAKANGKADLNAAIAEYTAELTKKVKAIPSKPTVDQKPTVENKPATDQKPAAVLNTTFDKAWDYKLENGKYYTKKKGSTPSTAADKDWKELTGEALNGVKEKVKFEQPKANTTAANQQPGNTNKPSGETIVKNDHPGKYSYLSKGGKYYFKQKKEGVEPKAEDTDWKEASGQTINAIATTVFGKTADQLKDEQLQQDDAAKYKELEKNQGSQQPKTEEKPVTDQKPKTENKPTTEEKPVTDQKPTTEEKPKTVSNTEKVGQLKAELKAVRQENRAEKKVNRLEKKLAKAKGQTSTSEAFVYSFESYYLNSRK